MNVFHRVACPQVVAKVEGFLESHNLNAGAVHAQVLLESDVYVAWNQATRALHSRVIPFETPKQAREAVRLLTTPAVRYS